MSTEATYTDPSKVLFDFIVRDSLPGEEPATVGDSVGADPVGDDDPVAIANTLRTTMLQARQALKEAITKEKKDTASFTAHYIQWAKKIGLVVGGAKIFSTTFDGIPCVIKLTRPQTNDYGIQYIKEG